MGRKKFIIGRAKNLSHLVIADSAVSRQHAMVKWVRGRYYMVDLDSANGTHHDGKQIMLREIREGDTFFVQNHEIRATYAHSA